MRKLLTTLVALFAIAAPSAALADGGRHGAHGSRHYGGHHGGHYGAHYGGRHWHSGPRFVWGFGAPYGWGPGYGYGYGYGYPYGGWGWPVPPLVLRERTVVREPVYVERGSDGAPDGTWYFCRSQDAYYPDVENCPEPWIPVPPRSE